jgi:hypothetical protein
MVPEPDVRLGHRVFLVGLTYRFDPVPGAGGEGGGITSGAKVGGVDPWFIPGDGGGGA